MDTITNETVAPCFGETDTLHLHEEHLSSVRLKHRHFCCMEVQTCVEG